MPEQLQNLLNRIRDWWQGMTTRQKALIISAATVVVVAIGILVFVVTRPTWVQIIECTSAEQSSTVQGLLEGESIAYDRSDNGMVYYVHKEDVANATILLGTNKIPNDGYGIDDALNGGFATTQADKEKRYQVYLEKLFEDQLETLAPVRSAQVALSIPRDDGTIIAKEEEAYAKVILELENENLIEDKATWASNLAKYMATGLGNDTTEHITIIDSNGNMLFSGGEETSAAGLASTNQSVKQQAETAAALKIRSTLANANSDGAIYDAVDVGVNLSMSFDNTNVVKYDYSVDSGREEGYLDSRTQINSESSEGVSGIPGTDSNNDTTYVLQDNQQSSSSSSEITEDFLPDETITTTDGEVGKIDYDDSSVAIVATRYVVYNEDDMRASGQLDDQTFDEFKAANSERTLADVDDNVRALVANATGIPVDNVSIIAYEVPLFQYSAEGRDITDYIQLIIALLVFLLLGFVVFRTLRKEEEEQVEEEVTVDQLLEQAAAEEPLEDLGVSEKSEARLLIEKFVDENPEAVANLLRNWLNEDWG